MIDSFELVLTSSDGKVKNTRFIKKGWEFQPNQLYLNFINKGHIEPNAWKVPFLFGSWAKRK